MLFLERRAHDAMKLKFGRIVNLEALEGLTTNKAIDDLRDVQGKDEAMHEKFLNILKVFTC